MIDRRSLLIGAACVAAAGVAHAATPRKHISLLGASNLEGIIPTRVGDWIGQDIGDSLALNDPESLSARLYSQIVSRQFINQKTGSQVVLLVAYGARQTDGLQLHRPEVCYPAFGYALTRNEPYSIPLAPGVVLPARRLAAEAEGRHESIIYWARIGEHLPRDGDEQRRDRLRIALQGVIPDGILMRFSAPATEAGGAWSELSDFILAALKVVPRQDLPALIGTERAGAFQPRLAMGSGRARAS